MANWTGPTAAAFVDALLIHQPIGRIEVATQYRARFHNLISGKFGQRGLSPVAGQDYAVLRQITGYTATVTGRTAGQDVVLPWPETPTNASVYLKQAAASVGYQLEEFEDAAGDAQLLTELVMGRYERVCVQGFSQVLNCLDMMDGTGRLAMVASYSGNNVTGTITVDNSRANFDVDLLALVENGMLIDIYRLTSAGGLSAVQVACEASRCVVSGVNKTAGTFVLTINANDVKSTLGTPADDDIVFLASSFTSTTQHATYGYEIGTITCTSGAASAGVWNMPSGILSIVDAGGNNGNEFASGEDSPYCGSMAGKFFQGLDRTLPANSMYRAQVFRASNWKTGQTDGTAYPATLDPINLVCDALFTSNSRPDPEKFVMVCSPATWRWIGAKAKEFQNGWTDISSNHVLAGLGLKGFLVTQTQNEMVAPVYATPCIPDGRIFFLDLGRLGIWERVPLGPASPDGKSSAQFAAPGRRDFATERWARTRYQIYASRSDTFAMLDDLSLSG